MTQQEKTCWGCVHRATRLRGAVARSWCQKYRTATNARCLDYLYKPKAIGRALRFVKLLSIK